MLKSAQLKKERTLFVVLLIIHLIPLWSLTFFLTTDGPSHVYNSRVLLDFITSRNVDFYEGYYLLNNEPNPNWFSHLILSCLQVFLPGYLSEKVFLSAYVILFMLAIRKLVKCASEKNVFLSWAAFPFIYNHVLQLGFYNSLFSMVLMLLVIYGWISMRQNSILRFILFPLLFTLLYFTHLVGLSFTLFFIAILILFEGNWQQRWTDILRNLSKKYAQLVLMATPALIFAVYYFNKVGTATSSTSDSVKKLYHDFIELSSLFCLVEHEKPFLITTAVGFGILSLYTLCRKIFYRKYSQADGFFLCFIVALIIYFNQPGGVAGGFLLKERLQMLPYLIILPWLATVYYPDWMKKLMPLFFAGVSLILLSIRLPYHVQASEAVEEIVSAREFISDRSTVLSLSYSFNGKTVEGGLIANKVWLFTHAADYLGAEKKKMILLGNYEANTEYFPLKWVESKNPFSRLGIIEGIPPHVDVEGYLLKTKGTVDYIMMLFLDHENELISHANTKSLLIQLDRNYKLVFRSRSGRVKLYKRR